MALEGARGVEGDFTLLPSPVKEGVWAGNIPEALAASLGCSRICQQLGVRKEGGDGARACTGLEEMSCAQSELLAQGSVPVWYTVNSLKPGKFRGAGKR